MREPLTYVTLDSLCNIIGGGTPSKANQSFYGGDIPWATVRDMHFDELNKTEHSITKEGLKKSSSNLIPSGNIIIATRVGLGKVSMLCQDTAVNQDLRGVIPKNGEVLPKFLFWYFKSISDKIISEGTGATVQGVKLPFIKSLLIPKIPLQEQKQIVAILDEAFEAIDQAKANIEKNIQNAKELFQSKLNEIFSQKGEGWEEEKLINLTTKIGSGATPRGGQSSYKTEGISLIRSMNVHDNGFKVRNLAFIDNEQAEKLNNVSLESGDVLLNITGASVARCCIVEDDYLPARVNQHVSIIRPIKEKISSKFLHLILTSKTYKDMLLGIGEQGATRQAITKAQIEQFKIAFPIAINEQESLSKDINIIEELTSSLEDNFKQKLVALDDLKKSILQKAFAGELTTKYTIA